MTDRIPDLTIERGDDGSFLLEQDGGSGNVERIELHATQVRHLAELAGLLPRRGDDYTPPAQLLARRLRALLDRIDRLDDMLRAIEAQGHENLEVESVFCYATWELATEFCADLGGLAPASRDVATSHAPVTRDSDVTPAAGTQPKPRENPAGSPATGEQLPLEG